MGPKSLHCYTFCHFFHKIGLVDGQAPTFGPCLGLRRRRYTRRPYRSEKSRKTRFFGVDFGPRSAGFRRFFGIDRTEGLGPKWLFLGAFCGPYGFLDQKGAKGGSEGPKWTKRPILGPKMGFCLHPFWVRWLTCTVGVFSSEIHRSPGGASIW